jgi:hypothetical protein
MSVCCKLDICFKNGQKIRISEKYWQFIYAKFKDLYIV